MAADPAAHPVPVVLRLALLEDLNLAIELFSEITGESRTQVLARLRQEHQRLGANVQAELAASGIEPHVWSEQLVEFYERTSAFLFESFVWNRLQMKEDLRAWIVDHLRNWSRSPLRILSYGDGLGSDSAALALAGHDVTYSDVGRQNAAFARRVFELNRVSVAHGAALQDLPAAGFDAVVCLDVLEHVPDPPTLVRQIARVLRPGGRLVVHAPFWYLHRTVPTHLRSNRKYVGDWRTVYAPAGLRTIDAHFPWMPLVLEKRASVAGALLPGARWRVAASQAFLTAVRWGLVPLTTVAQRSVRRDLRALRARTVLPDA